MSYYIPSQGFASSGGGGGGGGTSDSPASTVIAEAGTTPGIGNITLAGGAPNTLDGVTLAADDVVLVKNQTDGTQNGTYTVQTLGTGANGTWVRQTGMTTAAELAALSLVVVRRGTVNALTEWMCSTAPPYTLGVTVLTFVEFSAGGGSFVPADFYTTTVVPDATSIAPDFDYRTTQQTNTQAAGVLTVAAPTGTGSPSNKQVIIVQIKSTNQQTLAWDPVFVSSNSTNPPTVTSGGGLTDQFPFEWDELIGGTGAWVAMPAIYEAP